MKFWSENLEPKFWRSDIWSVEIWKPGSLQLECKLERGSRKLGAWRSGSLEAFNLGRGNWKQVSVDDCCLLFNENTSCRNDISDQWKIFGLIDVWILGHPFPKSLESLAEVLEKKTNYVLML